MFFYYIQGIKVLFISFCIKGKKKKVIRQAKVIVIKASIAILKQTSL